MLSNNFQVRALLVPYGHRKNCTISLLASQISYVKFELIPLVLASVLNDSNPLAVQCDV
uniref:Uncharacterized protein n=1 Tax=Kalanchoe fedtschenkoi TaxID=63787 RepID=A0A7N0T4Y4_KALFE